MEVLRICNSIFLLVFCIVSQVCAVFEHQNYEEFSKEVLKRHNHLRKIHNGADQDLELSKKLSKDANDFAKEAARDSSVLKNPKPGRNVFMACSTYNRALTGKEITDSWYDEVCHPTFKFSNPDNKQTRSFTQVVWRNSKKIGVGHAVTRKDHTMCTYVVAVYKPNGNVLGKFNENVLKGSFEKKKYCKKPKMSELKSNKDKKKKSFDRVKSKIGKNQFVLNKNPKKPALKRRTLYYKIPVNFVTAADSGKTFVVPLHQPTREESASRRSKPSLPENAAFDPESLKYRELGSERSNVKEAQDNAANDEESPDVQAEYIKDQLDRTAEHVNPERLSMFAKPSDYQDETELPSFENLKMIKPEKKSIEDEYAVNKIALNVHNALRKIHKAPLLKLSVKMSIAAENYAKFLAESNRFEHAANIAENLAFSCNKVGRIPSVAEAIKDWYQEVCMKDFDFDRDPSLPGTAHFTQIVWKSTKLLGIGRAIIRRGGMTCTYFVARYDPAGNWVGQFKENVKKADFSSSVCRNLTDIIKDAIGDLGDDSNAFESQGNKAEPVKDDDNEDDDKKPSQKPTKKPSEGKKPDKPSASTTTNPGASNCHMGSIEDQARFTRQALRVHNYFRHLHSSPPLGINEDLVRKALESAKSLCVKQKRSEITDKGIGENVGTACNFASQTVSAAEAVTNWYRQVCDKGYKFDREEASRDTAKFTQLVWKSTDEFGIAFATKRTKDNLFCTYVVAKYFPTGNKAGSYKDNVLRGSFTPSICDSLNTIAFNAAMQEAPVIASHGHWSIGPQVANQVLSAVGHVAGTFEPFKMPVYSEGNPLEPIIIKHSKRCNGKGAETAFCRAEIENQGLSIHNYFRKQHDSRPLKLSPSLSLGALNFAKKLLAQGKIQNSNAASGESIAIKCSEEFSVADAVKAWYKEVCNSNYDFSTEGLQDAGHFTQLVWKDTEFLGIGKATGMVNGVPCTAVVARYEPAGNVIGKFKNNVKPGTFTRAFCNNIDRFIDSQNAGVVAPIQPAVQSIPVVVSQGGQPAMGAGQGPYISDQSQAGQNPGQGQPSGEEFDDVTVKPVRVPEKNKGVNPTATQKHPSKTLQGETKPGAKQDKQRAAKKPGKVFSLGQAEPLFPSTEDEKNFNKEGLDIHNALRRYHSSGDLKLVDLLTNKAKNRCKNMIEKGSVSQGKRGNLVQQHGENMVILCDAVKTDYTAKDAIMNWYSEACDHKSSFADGEYNGRPNHFTQMVWKSTGYLGMAKVNFNDKMTGDFCSCIMALYKGPGNYIGRVKQNVKQGKFDPTKCSDPETILREAEKQYKEEKKQEKAKPIPPKKPPQPVQATTAPVSPTAPTTAGPPGSPDNSNGMPTPTAAMSLDASPTPVTQFTMPASASKVTTKAPTEAATTVPATTAPSGTTPPTTPGPPSTPVPSKTGTKIPSRKKPAPSKATQTPLPASPPQPEEAEPSPLPKTKPMEQSVPANPSSSPQPQPPTPAPPMSSQAPTTPLVPSKSPKKPSFKPTSPITPAPSPPSIPKLRLKEKPITNATPLPATSLPPSSSPQPPSPSPPSPSDKPMGVKEGPLGERPVGERPLGEKPIGEKPIGEKPVGKRPIGERPLGEKPMGERPMGERPMGERPIGERPIGERPMGERPMGERPMGERPIGERPIGERPIGERPIGERPMGERPIGERPMGERPLGEKPIGEKPVGERPAGERPGGKRPDGKRPIGKRPLGEKPRKEKPVEENPAEEMPSNKPEDIERKPVDQNGPTKRPGISKATEEPPATLPKIPMGSGPTGKTPLDAATTIKPGLDQSSTTPVPTKAKAPSQNAVSGTDFEEEGLEAHNLLRKLHGVRPLEKDEELSSSCADYAKRIAEKGALEHSDTKDGENLAMGCSSKNVEMSALQATKNWYKEACSPGFDFKTEKPNHGTGHFTQVVWKDSKILGIGKYTKEDKLKNMYCTYIVARYRPAGNWAGQYTSNVSKGNFDSQETCENIDKILAPAKKSKNTTSYRTLPRDFEKKSVVSTDTAVVNEEGTYSLQKPHSSYYLL